MLFYYLILKCAAHSRNSALNKIRLFSAFLYNEKGEITPCVYANVFLLAAAVYSVVSVRY